MRNVLLVLCLFFSTASYAASELIATEFDYRQIRWLSRERGSNQILDSGVVRSSTTGFNEIFDQSLSNSYGNASQNSFMHTSVPNSGPVYLYGSGSADAMPGAVGTYTTVESTFMGSFESQETFTGTLAGVLGASYVNTIGIWQPAALVKLWEGPAYVGGTVLWSSEAAAERTNEVLNFSHTHTFEADVMYVLEVTVNARYQHNFPDEDPGEYQYGSWEFTFELDVPVVNLDVLPGDSANKVYPNGSGKLPVAVLSSAEFDATQVDPATLRFGSAEATIAEAVSVSDVDSQFGDDITAKFKVQESGIFCNDTEVTLTGTTYAGDHFSGVDTIDSTECETGGCHVY
jgi:hypothetical protein